MYSTRRELRPAFVKAQEAQEISTRILMSRNELETRQLLNQLNESKRNQKLLLEQTRGGPKLNSLCVLVRLKELVSCEALERLPYDEKDIRRCPSCHVYQNFLSNVTPSRKIWACENCGFCNDLRETRPLRKIQTHDVEFVEPPARIRSVQPVPAAPASRSYIFCIDVSSGMNDERLGLAKSSCLKAIDEILARDPLSRVVITLFNNQGYFFDYAQEGGARPGSTTAAAKMSMKPTDSLMSRRDFEAIKLEEGRVSVAKMDLSRMSAFEKRIPPIQSCAGALREHIESLKTNRSTHVSDSLAFAVVLASLMKNCSVIICGDAEIEKNPEDRARQEFFDKVIAFANVDQTRIYMLALHDCKLYKFERLFRRTGGRLGRLDSKKLTDFNWIFEHEKQCATLEKYDTVTVLTSRGYLSVRCLYGREIFSPEQDPHKITVKNFSRLDPLELFVELSPSEHIWAVNKTPVGSVNDLTKTFIIQVQLASAAGRSVRVVTKTITLDDAPSLNKLLDYQKKPIRMALDGTLQNEALVSLIAWRYFAFHLLERREPGAAVEFFSHNRTRFKCDFLPDDELKSCLKSLAEKLERDGSLSAELDDKVTVFLSNILAETAFLTGSSHRISGIARPLRSRSQNPPWRPCGDPPSRIDEEQKPTTSSTKTESSGSRPIHTPNMLVLPTTAGTVRLPPIAAATPSKQAWK